MTTLTSTLAPILVIEGIDGSGKGTQAQLLRERLQGAGVRCSLLSFPRYHETFFGQRIGEFLNGDFGTLAELHPFLVSLLYSAERFESKSALAAARTGVDLLILDRYVPSNIAHQSAKVAPEKRQQLAEWIERIEYEIFELPRPACVVLLDTPVEISQELIARKSARIYTQETADLQEADTNYLSIVRDVYRTLAERNDSWKLLPVVDVRGELKTIEEISDALTALAQQLVGKVDT